MQAVITHNKHGIPGEAESLWIASSAGTDFPVLSQDILVDVAILGGGFVGIASAMLLKEAGMKVAVVEARRIVQGVTGNTTAKLSSLHRLIYKHLIDTFGKEQARQYAEANQTAIDKIESIIREKNIACNFSRLPFYTFAETDRFLKEIEEEVKAAQSLGLPASFVQTVPLPFRTKGAIRLENQAQFHPRRYLLPLAQMIPGNGSFIFEKTRAVNIEDGEPCTVTTDKGKIAANAVIIATNFPIQDQEGLYFARMEPMRSYVLGVKVKEPFPQAMFINAEEEGHSFRAQPADHGEILIVGGEDHVTGHESNTVRRYQAMAEFVNRIYSKPQIEYSWSTQDSITVDRAPYIGKLTPQSKHVLVATGFGQWGMTTSAAAAMILSDFVQGRTSPWAEVFDPSRLKPDASAAKKLVTQNLKVIQKLVGGHLAGKAMLEQVAPGEGKIVEVYQQRAAAYRDEQDKLFVLDSKCTHMGCAVTWNNAERTWDCPCHGSRYNYYGEVIQSPAVQGLSPIEVKPDMIRSEEVQLASTADVPSGKMIEVQDQGHKILLANVEGQYYAIRNICTHMGCSLTNGTLKGDQVQCRCHGSVFNVKTGEVIHGPAKKPEPIFQLKVEGDRIMLVR